MGHKNRQAGHIWVLGCNLLSNFTWLSVGGLKRKGDYIALSMKWKNLFYKFLNKAFKKKWKELDERIQCVGGERPVLFDIV